MKGTIGANMRRLILIIIILAVFLVFIMSNMKNACLIAFGPIETSNEVPIFVSVLFAFLLGMIFSLPFGISLSRRLKKDSKTELPTGKKKRWGKKGKADAENAPAELEEIKKDPGTHGVG